MAYTFTSDLINPDCLTQTEKWFDARGKEYNVHQMSKRHLQGARRKLFGAFGGKVCHTPLYNAMMAAERRVKL